MAATGANLESVFAGIVGVEHVRVAGDGDRVDQRQPRLVVAPGTAEEVAATLQAANERGLSVIPRGGATKLDWGNSPRAADLILSTQRLNKLIEHAYGDMTASAQAGMTVADLEQSLAAHGQMFALDPAWPERATLGGVVAADASGPMRVRYGTARDLLIGIEVALPDGTVARGGGKVVKNVAGYDLMKLFTGSLGTLGLITAVTIRLHPLPATTTSLLIDALSATQAEALVLHLNQSTLTPTGVQVVSAADGHALSVRFAGLEDAVQAQVEQLSSYVAGEGLQARPLAASAASLAWSAHGTIYDSGGDAVVARFSVLPGATAASLRMFRDVAKRLRVVSRVVMYGTGTGIVRFDSANAQALAAVTGVVRERVAAHGGAFVVHHYPIDGKEKIDVWGLGGNALPLMRRVKEQFDPKSILNPGRFIGRI